VLLFDVKNLSLEFLIKIWTFNLKNFPCSFRNNELNIKKSILE